MVDEGKAALLALLGYVVIFTEAAMILNALAAHAQGADLVGAVLFGPDVDLLAPVLLAFGQFAAEPGVPTEVRAADVLDRELLGSR